MKINGIELNKADDYDLDHIKEIRKNGDTPYLIKIDTSYFLNDVYMIVGGEDEDEAYDTFQEIIGQLDGGDCDVDFMKITD